MVDSLCNRIELAGLPVLAGAQPDEILLLVYAHG
jgi:hypothetical protein